MTTHRDHFDEQELMALKAQRLGYRFCPRCGGELRLHAVDGRERLVCLSPSCGYIFYHNPTPAAGALVVENDRILMVRRAHPPRVGWWCLPAGFMEWDETPRQCAVRELREETGLEVELSGIFDVYSGNDDPRTNAVLVLYLARRVGGELKAADDALEVRFFAFDSLPDKIAFESHIRALSDYQQRFRRGPV